MLAIVLAAVTATTATAPSPSPTPLLQTIVTVKSSPICGAFAAHTNAAIGSALANDQSLGTTILTLRSPDLAGTSLDRSSEIHHLNALADAIYKQYRAGEREVNELRDLANKATDPDEKAALRAVADALGGALYRQHLMQRDLDGLVNYLYASDMMSSDDDPTADPDVPRRQFLEDVPGAHPINGSLPVWTPQDTPLAGTETLTDDVTMARAASQDFLTRLPALRLDEQTAGTRIETAADKC
ncbi:MAG TPA: hypothetical protein VMB20_11370 [Candidatus Acidoferrum sp.]|nr:hypothetical protein [Candidatus Acidoferrum sp.]